MLSLYVLTNKELYWSSRVRVETMNGLGLHVYVREIWYIVHKNVFNMFEPHLPMRGIKVRAYDIDTYNDYLRVSELTKDWKI
mgnify:CR=1 FL=1